MPNKTNTSRTRVSKNTRKGGFKFRWWMAAGLVVVVALVGVLVLRYSKAAGGTVAQFGGNSCTRVTLTHVYAKASIPSNVCLATVGIIDNLGRSIYYDHNVQVGRPATYCIWGRYSAKPGEEPSISLDLIGGGEGYSVARGKSVRYRGSDSGVTGYGTNFQTSGDNIKLACTYTDKPGVSQFRVNGDVFTTAGPAGNFLVFLDQITVEY